MLAFDIGAKAGELAKTIAVLEPSLRELTVGPSLWIPPILRGAKIQYPY